MSRPTLRETVGVAVNASNLASDSNKEKPLDRIAALARADAFGSALWRLKVGGDRSVLKRAAILLAHRARQQGMVSADWTSKGGRRTMPRLLLIIAERLVSEWLQDKCSKCKGRGRTGMGKGKVVRSFVDCRLCQGSGRIERVGPLTASLLVTGKASYTKKYRWRGKIRTQTVVIKRQPEEVEIPTVPCHLCHGRGKVALEAQVVTGASLGKVCSQCEGSGRARINGAARARVVGVSTQAYWKTWHPRFAQIRRLLIEADWQTSEDVRLALRGPRKTIDLG